jgi:hypothetical protein
MKPSSAVITALLICAAIFSMSVAVLGSVIRLDNLATGSLPTPSASNEGALAYDSTIKQPKWSDGVTWYPFSTGDGGSGSAGSAYVFDGGASSLVGDGVNGSVTPGSDDEEFNYAQEIPSAWTLGGKRMDGGEPLNYNSAWLDGGYWSWSMTDRPGWLKIQPDRYETTVPPIYQIMKDFTAWTTDWVIYFSISRVGPATLTTSTDNANGTGYFYVGAPSGAVIDTNNYCYFALWDEDVGPVVSLHRLCVINGVSTGVLKQSYSHTIANGVGVESWTLGAWQKVGNSLYAWIGNSSGNWSRVSATAIDVSAAAAFSRVALRLQSGAVAGTAPGNVVYGIDYVRFRRNTSNLP